MTLSDSPSPDSPTRLSETSLAEEIEFLAARVRAIGSSHANARLGELELTVRSYSVLSLAASGLRPSQRELADFLSLNPSQIVTLVDRLVEQGLVVRQQDSKDRRSNGIRSTELGDDIHARAQALLRDAEAHTLGPLTTDERTQLRMLLKKIAWVG